jgi:hypothetical protein
MLRLVAILSLLAGVNAIVGQIVLAFMGASRPHDALGRISRTSPA